MTDEWEEEDHDDEPFEDEEDSWGCLFPEECCMPGLHMISECHTPVDLMASIGAQWGEHIPVKEL